MAVETLYGTSVASNTGWNANGSTTGILGAPDAAAAKADSTGNVITVNVADISGAPIGHDATSVTYGVRASNHAGTDARGQNLLVELLANGAVVASFTTGTIPKDDVERDYTGTVAVTHGRAQTDTYQVRVTLQAAGGGMSGTIDMRANSVWAAVTFTSHYTALSLFQQWAPPLIPTGRATTINLDWRNGAGNTFSVLSGSLPPGMTLNATTGKVEGTPTTEGSYTFAIRGVDNQAVTVDSSPVSVQVVAPHLTDDVQVIQYSGDGAAAGQAVFVNGVDLSAGGAVFELRDDGEARMHYSPDGATVYSCDTKGGNTDGHTGGSTASFANGSLTIQPSGTSNASGSTYTVIAIRKTAGLCDVHDYTGNGGTLTVNHGFGTLPAVILTDRKSHPSAQIYCYNRDRTGSIVYQMNGRPFSSTGAWSSVTSTSYQHSDATILNNAEQYGTVILAQVPGKLQAGILAGNGTAEGLAINCGAVPKVLFYGEASGTVDAERTRWYVRNDDWAGTEQGLWAVKGSSVQPAPVDGFRSVATGLVVIPTTEPFNTSGRNYFWLAVAGPATAEGGASPSSVAPATVLVPLSVNDAAVHSGPAIGGEPYRDARFAVAYPALDPPAVVNMTPPYAFSISAGALPDGLALDPSAGTLSGTPTKQGMFNFSLRVEDSLSQVLVEPLSIEIGDVQPARVFQMLRYVGNGAGGTRTFSTTVDLSAGGMVLVYSDGDTSNTGWLFGSVDGQTIEVQKHGSSNLVAAPTAAFANGSFTIEADTSASGTNVSGKNYRVTVIGKAPGLVDIVRYVGNDAAGTRLVPHSLGVTPIFFGAFFVHSYYRMDVMEAGYGANNRNGTHATDRFVGADTTTFHVGTLANRSIDPPLIVAVIARGGRSPETSTFHTGKYSGNSTLNRADIVVADWVAGFGFIKQRNSAFPSSAAGIDFDVDGVNNDQELTGLDKVYTSNNAFQTGKDMFVQSLTGRLSTGPDTDNGGGYSHNDSNSEHYAFLVRMQPADAPRALEVGGVSQPVAVGGIAGLQATVTLAPDSVAVVPVVSNVTVQGANLVLEVDAVASLMALGAVTLTSASTLAVDGAVLAPAVGDASLLASASMQPDAVVTAVTVGAPILAATANLAPGPVALTPQVGAVTLDQSLAPASVDAPLVVEPLTLAAVATLSPDAVAAPLQVGAVNLGGIAAVAPDTVALASSAGPVAFATTATVSPDATAVPAQVQAPTLIGDGSLQPQPVAANAQVGAVALLPGVVTLAPDSVPLTAAVGAVDVGASAGLVPLSVFLELALADPALLPGGVIVAPGTVLLLPTVAAATLAGGSRVAPTIGAQRPRTIAAGARPSGPAQAERTDDGALVAERPRHVTSGER